MLEWERKRIPLAIDVPNVLDIYVDEMRRELDGWPGFNYQNWQTAAQFCASNKINLDEALVWADKAIREPFRGAAFGHEDFSTLNTKAAVLEAMGRAAEADVLMARALTLPGTPSFLLYAYGMQLLRSRKNDTALAVFEQNAAQHPEEPYWTELGLARGYTAKGDKARAIRAWENALAHVPDYDKDSIPQHQQTLKALKGGS
jgi:tetratricopeptide (TPR) repeat protein